MDTNKIKEALSLLVEKVLSDFEEKGGVVGAGSGALDPAVIASPLGGLPAILWVVQQFYSDYSLDFPSLTFKADASAYTGYALESVQVAHSASPVLLMLSDFVRNEMLPEHVIEFDMEPMLTNFRDWCRDNVSATPGATPQSTHGQEGNLYASGDQG